jgi:multidrug resistance efflux pump
MRRRAVVFVLSALLVACILFQSGCGKKDPPTGTGIGTGTASTGGSAPAAEAKHIDAFGIVKPKITHTIFLEFPAVLEKKLVAEGQKVWRGEALFRLSSREYDARVNSKRHELTMARLELKKAGLDVKKLQEDLQAAQDDADKAQKDLRDKEELFSMGAASKSDVEETQRTLKARQQKVRDLTRSLEEYNGSDVNSLEAQGAKIAIIEEELERLRDQSDRPYISNNTIVCDVREGVVSEIGYAEGDFISRDKKLCSIIDLDSIIVEANVPEEFIKDVRIGSKAVVVPVADNARSYEGKVTRISSQAMKNNGETVIPVEITLGSRDGFLLPNFNVDVSIY